MGNHTMFVIHYPSSMLTKIIDCVSISMREAVREEDICTGTVRANRKGLPPSINKKKTIKNTLVVVGSEQ